ncbi:ABC transporter permease [Mumia sp. zg.B53]|uniref:ABC transporter permease n=1 Tax=unclassified Mumia TaxID=2621872 RepID=UPI001C6E4795|nr:MULTISPECIES: ABC transporter permease [unclassified Mumia]MBW9209534.1 ABC transporter permease [Mumia sp. zg.B21]MBW9214139.1 ABC transporter permease [Mumia sp. zg.B53]
MNELAGAIDLLLDPESWKGGDGLWTQLVEQVLLTVTALVLVLVVGLPLALWLGHRGRGGTFAINVSNVGRAVPVFAVLGLLALGPIGTTTLGPYGRAGLATLIALVLFGLPPVITNSYVGVREVDAEIVEAARGTGMSEWQVFRRIELPLASQMVANGVRLALVQLWATATIAALVAGPGLGNVITYGFSNNSYDYVIAGAILVAGGALVLEGLAAVVERRVDPMRRVTGSRHDGLVQMPEMTARSRDSTAAES